MKVIAKAKYGLFFASPDFLSARISPSTKIFDYMFWGTVPVATEMKATADIIDDGENGILIPEGDEENYLRYISEKLYLTSNQFQPKQKVLAKENYTWDQEAKKLIDLYNVLSPKT
jgi:glycosyltransferase involved in cell wall biosynthesis